MLPVLFGFMDKFPQRNEDGSLNYLPFGSSAIRILEEEYKNKTGKFVRDPPRVISDVDLVLLKPGLRYPVHSTNLNDIFNTGLCLDLEDAMKFSKDVTVYGRTLRVPAKELIIASKSVSVQAVRPKDFDDVYWVNSMGIDKNVLTDLYRRCIHLPREGIKVVDLLTGSLDELPENKDLGYKLFATLPQRASVLNSFKGSARNRAETAVRQYLEADAAKDGYQLSRVLGDVSLALDYVPSSRKFSVLNSLLTKARSLHYTEFDSFVHQRLIPSLKYAPDNETKLDFLKSLQLVSKF